MTDVSTLAKFHLADMTVEYLIEDPSRSVGLRIYPTSMEAQITEHRSQQGIMPGRILEPLVQLKLAGDPVSSYSQGLTMRNSATLDTLQFEGQQVDEGFGEKIITTRLVSERGYAVDHRLIWRAGDTAFTVQTIFSNRSAAPLALEMLASFSIGGITPFAADDAPGRLALHRFRSYWSAEGRHDRRMAEDLALEPSWARHGVRVERFGQVGSMPVRGFFPWAGVEDAQAGVMWGAHLAVPGSWQMEFYRKDDFLSLSGGLADREYGHWMKTVAPGESFTTPAAYLTTVRGDLDDLCARLVRMQLPAAEAAPESEHDLPVLCNEWCTSWGNPRHDDLVAMADKLQGSGIRYLVIDAGWYRADEGNWFFGQGDWIANKNLFPHGLAAAAQAIRERGLIPGIWFEMEVAGEQSPRFASETEHFLKRDGLPITAAGRHFWDFRDPWVIDYLSEKVIGQLRDCGLGYIKVDYNETIGIGCDTPGSAGVSQGEGLRQHLDAVQGFFRKMRAEIPDLVIENCASGGHRLEPSFMGITSMASFSDAHETKDIPVIAASLHRLILPRQSQIWAVLHAADPDQRLVYLLTGGFLGRLCISGEIAALSEAQWKLVQEAVRFYAQAAGVIARGSSRLFQQINNAWQHLEGAQALLRISEDGQKALIVAHSFGAPLPAEIQVPLPGEGWQVDSCFPASSLAPQIADGKLIYRPAAEWQGAGWILSKIP